MRLLFLLLGGRFFFFIMRSPLSWTKISVRTTEVARAAGSARILAFIVVISFWSLAFLFLFLQLSRVRSAAAIVLPAF